MPNWGKLEQEKPVCCVAMAPESSGRNSSEVHSGIRLISPSSNFLHIDLGNLGPVS